MFRDLRIRSLLGLGFGAVLAASLIFFTVTFFNIKDIESLSRRVNNLRTPTAKASTEMISNVNQALAALRGWIILGDDKFKAERKNSWRAIRHAESEMASLSGKWTEEINVYRFKKVQALLIEFERFQMEIENIAHRPENVPAVRLLFDEAVPRAEVMAQHITKIIEIQKRRPGTNAHLKLFAAMADVRGTMGLFLSNIRAYLISKDEKFKANFTRLWKSNEGHMATLSGLTDLMTEEQRVLFNSLVKVRGDFAMLPSRMFALREKLDWNQATYWLKTKAAPVGQQLVTILEEMVESQRNLLEQDATTIENLLEEFKRNLVVFVLFVTSLSVGVVIIVNFMVTKPIAGAVKMAEQIALGNFGVVVESHEEYNTTFETKILAMSLRTMARELEATIDTIRASEAVTRTIVENSLIGMILIDGIGKVSVFNPAAEKIFGYRADEVLGQNILMLMPEPYKSQHDGYLRHHMKTNEGQLIGKSRELEGLRKNGTVFPIILGLSQVELGGEAVFIGMITDISERKEAENVLRQSQKMESLGSLAGGMAHEVNNMLVPILNMTSGAIKTLPEDRPERKNLAIAVEAAERVRDLVEKILAFSRKEQTELQEMNIFDVFERDLELLSSTLPSTVTLVKNLDPNTGTILANEGQISSIILNLASNSADAMTGKSGTLEVSLLSVDGEGTRHLRQLTPGKYAHLSVSDTGVGMDKETLRRIFDPFFTLKEAGEGTGMGLSMIYGIVADYDGVVHVSSTPNKGTTVNVYLPLMRTDSTDDFWSHKRPMDMIKEHDHGPNPTD